MSRFQSRRTFLKSTLAGTGTFAFSAASYARIRGANERISIGLIGAGRRGQNTQIPNIAKHAKQQNVEITAACDPWRVSRERAAAGIREAFGREARLFETHGDLLDAGNIDAVMITSCDHHHARQLEAAVHAGMDVYCEKPIAKNLDELNRAYDAVKESKQLVQVGTQSRSFPTIGGARKVYASGVLGTVSRIEQRRNGKRPFWYGYIRDVRSADVNWDEFVMGCSSRAFDSVAYSAWMGYRDFCDGPIPQLGVHYLDTVHFITGAELPESCVCHGGTFTWKDEHRFDVPDHVQALWTYPDGFMVSYSTNFGNAGDNTFKITGNEGFLDLTDSDAPLLSTVDEETKPVEPIPTPDHWLDWMQCLRSRKAPRASIEAGYHQTVACLMAVEAYDTGRRVVFDRERRAIQEG